MLSALAESKASAEWKKDRGQYVPKPLNWLLDEPWLESCRRQPTVFERASTLPEDELHR